MSFLLLYNYLKKLKSLKFKTPYDTIIQIYQDNPEYFKLNPESKVLGLNNYIVNNFVCIYDFILKLIYIKKADGLMNYQFLKGKT